MYYGQIRPIFSQIFECVCMSRTGPNAELQDQKDPLRQWARSNMLRGYTTWPQVLRALGDWASASWQKQGPWMADGNIDKIWQNFTAKFIKILPSCLKTYSDMIGLSLPFLMPKAYIWRSQIPEISWRLKGIQAKDSIPSFPSLSLAPEASNWSRWSVPKWHEPFAQWPESVQDSLGRYWRIDGRILSMQKSNCAGEIHFSTHLHSLPACNTLEGTKRGKKTSARHVKTACES
jgi:hypothetical protein